MRLLGIVALVLFGAIAFTPLTSVVAGWLAVPPRLEAADAIVVLGGGGVRGDGTLTDTSLRRTLHGIVLFQRGLAPIMLLSGSPGRSRPTESEARAAVARTFGVPASAILTEGSALTTHEEAERIARRLRPLGVRRVLLVVDAEGMRRAMGAFTRAGLAPVPAPASDVSGVGGTPEGRLDLARRVLMELCALAYYRLAGYV